ncbi:MAG: hypothetical protein R3181_04150 [Rubricoccaceae bacterium]|nr:hypothetical protein [Rubricoccaceae bacterium]
MSSTVQARQSMGASAPTSRPARQSSWIVVNRTPHDSPETDQACVRQVSRDVECLRAACVSAGPLRRWWLRRRLRTLEKQKLRMEQHWRRAKLAAPAPSGATPLGG